MQIYVFLRNDAHIRSYLHFLYFTQRVLSSKGKQGKHYEFFVICEGRGEEGVKWLVTTLYAFLDCVCNLIINWQLRMRKCAFFGLIAHSGAFWCWKEIACSGTYVLFQVGGRRAIFDRGRAQLREMTAWHHRWKTGSAII